METGVAPSQSRFRLNLYAHVHVLGERERCVQRLARRCRGLMSEMLERSERLGVYARDLVDQQKRVWEMEEEFGRRCGAKWKRKEERERELLGKLREVREEKRRVEKELGDSTSESMSLVEWLGKMAETERELRERRRKAKGEIAGALPDLPLELFLEHVNEVKEKIGCTENEIELVKKRVREAGEARQALAAMRKKVLRVVRKMNREKQEMVKSNTEEREQWREMKRKVDGHFEKRSQRELRVFAAKTVVEKKVDELTKELEKTEEETWTSQAQFREKQKLQEVLEGELGEVVRERQEVEQRVEELRHTLSDKELSLQELERWKCSLVDERESIAAELQQIKDLKAAAETEIQTGETEYNMEREIAETQRQYDAETQGASEIDNELQEVSRKVVSVEKEEQQYQRMLDETLFAYQSLKNKLRVVKHEEQKLEHTHFGAVEEKDLQGKDIDEAKHSVAVILRGYEVQLMQTQEQCRHLDRYLKFEELKIRFRKAGYKRVSAALEAGITGTMSAEVESLLGKDYDTIFGQRSNDRKATTDALETSVDWAGTKVSGLQQKLTKSVISAIDRAAELEHVESELNDEPHSADDCQFVVEEFCHACEFTLTDTLMSVDRWRKWGGDDQQQVLKDWFQTISKYVRHAEAMEMRAHRFCK